ncbi:MAG: hypothetical protein WBV59_08355, partial [Anaerolineae bacterium]
SLTVITLNIHGGILDGSTDVIVDDLLEWTAGDMEGTGRTIINGQLVIPDEAILLLDGREIINNGAGTVGNGADIYAIHGAIFRNTAVGTLDILGAGTMGYCRPDYIGGTFTCGSNIGPQPAFVNVGTVTHSGSGRFSLMGTHTGLGPGPGPVLFTNSGTVRINAGEMAFEPYVQTAGVTYLSGGNIISWGPVDIQGGTLSGWGTIGSSVSNAGTIEVGGVDAPGTLTITSVLLAHYPPDPPIYVPGGNYNQTATGALNIELGGTTLGTQYDQLIASGNVTLSGTLDVRTIGGYTPAIGAGFTVMTYGSRSGSFAIVNGNGRNYTTNYGTQALTLTAGQARGILPVASRRNILP